MGGGVQVQAPFFAQRRAKRSGYKRLDNNIASSGVGALNMHIGQGVLDTGVGGNAECPLFLRLEGSKPSELVRQAECWYCVGFRVRAHISLLHSGARKFIRMG